MVGLSEWCSALWHTQDVALQMLLAHSYTRQNFSSLRCMRGQNEQVNHCPVTFTQRMYCGGSISHPLCSFHKSLSVLGPCSEYTREMALCLPREGPTWFHTQDTTQSFPLLHAGPRALLVLRAVPRPRSALTASARRPCPLSSWCCPLSLPQHHPSSAEVPRGCCATRSLLKPSTMLSLYVLQSLCHQARWARSWS